MKNKNKTLNYLFVLIGVLLMIFPGCKKDVKDTTEPVYPTSSLSFDYSGFLSGTYSVTGALPLSPDPGTSISDYEWADALVFEEYGVEWAGVMANFPTGNGRESTYLQIHIKNPGTGDFALPGRGSYDVLCFGMNGPGNQQNFLFTSGTIIVTSYKSNRIMGTFSGTLEMGQGEVITISNGVFNMHVTHE